MGQSFHTRESNLIFFLNNTISTHFSTKSFEIIKFINFKRIFIKNKYRLLFHFKALQSNVYKNSNKKLLKNVLIYLHLLFVRLIKVDKFYIKQLNCHTT